MLIFSSGFCLHLYLLLSYFFHICEREDLVPKDQKVWVSSFDNNSIFFLVEALILCFLLFQVQLKEAEWLHCLSDYKFNILTLFTSSIGRKNPYILTKYAWHEWLVFPSIGLYGCLVDIFVICRFLCMWSFTTKNERSIGGSLEARVEWFVWLFWVDKDTWFL